MKLKERKAIVKSIINLDLSVVIEHYVKDGLCPFHSDKNRGSFSYNKRKDMYKCFSCNIGGKGAISFIRSLKKVSYKEAIDIIAVELFGYNLDYSITKNILLGKMIEEKMKREKTYSENKSFQERNDKEITPTELESKKKKYDPLKVYYALDRFCKVLTKADEEYLVGRGITKMEIERRGYLSLNIQTKEIIKKNFKKHIEFSKKNFFNWYISDFFGVSGFYLNSEGKIDLHINAFNAGIGIPIRNSNKEVVAYQIRTNNKESKFRYLWWSSINKLYGGSPSTPVDVIYPLNEKYEKDNLLEGKFSTGTKTVYLTEGHFKGSSIVRETGCVAFSIQGITNWRKIEDELETYKKHNYIQNSKEIEIKLAFDSDWISNFQVLNQMFLLLETLLKLEYRVQVLLWSPEYGKGIDDYYENKNKNKSMREAEGLKMARYLDSIVEGAREENIPNEKIEEYTKERTSKMRSRLLKM